MAARPKPCAWERRDVPAALWLGASGTQPPTLQPTQNPQERRQGSHLPGSPRRGGPPSPGEWEWSLTGRILVESTDLNKVVLGSDPDSATELNK